MPKLYWCKTGKSNFPSLCRGSFHDGCRDTSGRCRYILSMRTHLKLWEQLRTRETCDPTILRCSVSSTKNVALCWLAHNGLRAKTTCIGVNHPVLPPRTKLSAPSLNIELVATLLAGAKPKASRTTSK